jgi:hypothetical protein
VQSTYHVRRTSKERANELQRSGRLGQSVLLDTLNGFLVIEPEGDKLGDGAVLSPEEADFELRPPWYTGPWAKLREVRRMLGLKAAVPVGA